MAATAKAMRISGLNVKSLFLTGLVIVLVIALFFIPEIIKFQRSLTGGSSAVSSTTATKKSEVSTGSDAAEVSPSESKVNPDEPLSEITTMLEHGYIDRVKAKKVVSTQEKQSPLAAGVVPGDGRLAITWENLRNEASANVLRTTQKQALDLARQLSDKYGTTRFALFSFANSIRLVLEGGEGAMDPMEGVKYVEFSRMNVTRAMEREDVDRGVYNSWVMLSLGPVIDQYRGFSIADVPKPFDPQPTLTSVSLFKPGTNYGRWIERAPVYLYFKGYVIGKDVSHIEYFLNGNKVGEVKPGGTDPKGRRPFAFGQGNGRGLYTLRFHDKFGAIYEKHYNFYPKVRSFPWRRGAFHIPRISLGDKRLDRFFAVRPGKIYGVSSPNFFDATEISHF